MRTKLIVLAVLAAVSLTNRVVADEIFRQQWHDWTAEEREKQERAGTGSSDSSSGCGAGCVLMLGVAAMAVYEYAKRQRELREQRESERAAQDPDDEIWRVKAVPDQYTRDEYLTVFAEPSVASQALARLTPGFSGLRMAGECQEADETRGMCPVLIPVRDRFYRGWIAGDIIEPVSRSGGVY